MASWPLSPPHQPPPPASSYYFFIQTILSSTSSPLGLLSVGNYLLIEWFSPGHIWTHCELWQGNSLGVWGFKLVLFWRQTYSFVFTKSLFTFNVLIGTIFIPTIQIQNFLVFLSRSNLQASYFWHIFKKLKLKT